MISLLLFVPMTSGPALAQTAPTKPPAADTQKKTCRSVRGTASRLDVKRTCLTPAQWRALDGVAEGDFRRDMDRSRSGSGGR